MSYEVYIDIRHGNKHADELDTESKCWKLADDDLDYDYGKQQRAGALQKVIRCLDEIANDLLNETMQLTADKAPVVADFRDRPESEQILVAAVYDVLSEADGVSLQELSDLIVDALAKVVL